MTRGRVLVFPNKVGSHCVFKNIQLCAPISKQISHNICKFQLLLKNREAWSPRTAIPTCSNPQAPLPTGACFSPTVLGCLPNREPKGDPVCRHTCLICKQTVLKEHNLRSFCETNWTFLPMITNINNDK